MCYAMWVKLQDNKDNNANELKYYLFKTILFTTLNVGPLITCVTIYEAHKMTVRQSPRTNMNLQFRQIPHDSLAWPE